MSAPGPVVPITRALPFVLVAMFGLLVVGGIALSLSSAEPLAQQQLRDSAGATLSASGFALVDTNSVRPLASAPPSAGQGPETVVFRVLYRAPDAVEESEPGPGGTTMAVILVGSRRFQGNGSQWTQLPPSKGGGEKAAQTILAPLRAAAAATAVTSHGDVYDFVPPRLGALLTSILGVRATQLASPKLTAVVHGDFLTQLHLGAEDGSVRLQVDLVFSHIGSAPPVTAPPASSLVPSSAPMAP